MRRLLIISLLASSAVGCRSPHLADDYGDAYHAAFQAQVRDRSAAPPAPMDAEDARNTLAAQREPAASPNKDSATK